MLPHHVCTMPLGIYNKENAQTLSINITEQTTTTTLHKYMRHIITIAK